MNQKISSIEKFAKRFKILENGCWQWTAGTNFRGYGRFYAPPKNEAAHRYAYEIVKGKIPEGLTIDHLCRNTGCVNPAHLEAVTGKENNLRSNNIPALNARKTHCIRGHPFTVENTYHPYGQPSRRQCKECVRITSRNWQRNKFNRKARILS